MQNPTYKEITAKLESLGTPERARASAWFFKMGEGEYGHGDVFIGITVPMQRKVAREFRDLGFEDIKRLLESNIHEYRFTALEILVMRYERGDGKTKRQVVAFYVKHIDRVNNWDLVDTSAPYMLGHYLLARPKTILYRFAKSKNIWRRRVAVVATAYFIGQEKFEDTLAIAELLINDKHDLIHKAVGWMLREVGRRSPKTLTVFLDKHYQHMPRTMLRYAIERLPAKQRIYYLKKRETP